MPFQLLPGRFFVVGYEPDGDSIRFRPDDASGWGGLGRRPKLNAKGEAQLRLQGVDTLETHFQAQGLGTLRQPRALGDAARDDLLAMLGITGVEVAGNGTTITGAEGDGARGYILTDEVDGYRRPVAFAFAGDPPDAAGEVFLEPTRLRESVNRKLIEKGLAYPVYYTNLFYDLRDELTAAARDARGKGLGVWAEDRSERCVVRSLASLTEEQVILPKLFRRLTAWIADNGGDVSLDGFLTWLERDEERVFVLPLGQPTGFDNVLEVDGDTVGLRHEPWELAFVPRR